MEIYNSFQTSVKKALDEIDINWPKYKGLIICGTHSPHNIEEMIERIKNARENKIPVLLICAGHQLGWIEYCKNVLNIKDATSAEFSKDGIFVVKKRDELKVGLHDGETYWSNYWCDFSFGEWKKQDNFFTSQFHPEYQSSKDKPHLLLKDFIKYAKNLS